MSETRSLFRRIMNMTARGVIASSNDRHSVQQQDLSILDNEAKVNVERFQDYGFSSHPKVGAEAVIQFWGGGRDHGMILKCDDREYRIRGLLQGEVAIYTDEADTIILKRNNVIEITTKTCTVKAETAVNVQSPTVNVAGKDGEATTLNVTGSVNIAGKDGGDANVAITGNLSASKTITADTVNAPHGNVGTTER